MHRRRSRCRELTRLFSSYDALRRVHQSVRCASTSSAVSSTTKLSARNAGFHSSSRAFFARFFSRAMSFFLLSRFILERKAHRERKKKRSLAEPKSWLKKAHRELFGRRVCGII